MQQLQMLYDVDDNHYDYSDGDNHDDGSNDGDNSDDDNNSDDDDDATDTISMKGTKAIDTDHFVGGNEGRHLR